MANGPNPTPAERILELADLPPVSETGGPAAIDRMSATTPEFMRSMLNQLPVPESPDRAPRDEPFSAYLEDTARQIRRLGSELEDTVESTLRRQTRIGNTACCIIFAIYRLILNRSGRETTYEAMRAVEEEKVLEWLRIFRDLLINLRQADMKGLSVASFQLNLLSIDISGLIYDIAKSMLVGLAMAFLSWVESQIASLHDMVADDLQSTRCEPLIRLWSAVLNWLYDQAHGLVGRLRGLVQDQLIKMHRKIQSMMKDAPNAGGSVSLSGDSRQLGYIDDIILVLDALIAAIDVFQTCRLPPPEEDTGDDDGDGGDDDDDDRRRGDDDDDDDGGDDRPDSSDLTEQFDPDLGRVSTLDVDGPSGPGGEEQVFLTPPNVAKFLVQEFDFDRQEAQSLAAGQSCRDEISQETEQILEEIGIFGEQ